MGNVLFSRLIVDISTRVFVSCYQYEVANLSNGRSVKGMELKSVKKRGREVDKLEEIKEDRDELSDDSSAMQSTGSSSLKLDDHGNERKIEESGHIRSPPQLLVKHRESVDISEQSPVERPK